MKCLFVDDFQVRCKFFTGHSCGFLDNSTDIKEAWCGQLIEVGLHSKGEKTSVYRDHRITKKER